MKILLVEDGHTLALLMKARLTQFGYEVVHAVNGQIAVELFRKEAPDLVLMDIEMPVMNGFEATNRIRALEATQVWAWTPIIFITASDTVDNLITAIEAGGDDFMAKSLPEPVLRAKMKAMSRIAALRKRLMFANGKLEELASLDGLTGLCNRRNMDLRVDEGWEYALNNGCSFGLFMLDIDNFKKYNDHYGHQAGDDCLRKVAGAIANEVNKFNIADAKVFAARYGGEEFSVIMLNATKESFDTIAQSLVTAVSELAIVHENNGEWGVVTISVGGIRIEAATGQVVSLFREADKRLYLAKEQGRNQARTGQE
jgi:diguanylate cyclase (GGDEF)-like protein